MPDRRWIEKSERIKLKALIRASRIDVQVFWQYCMQWRALILEMAIAERDRWPLWLPVAMGFGIGLYFALPFEPHLTLSFLAIIVPGLLVVLAYGQKIFWEQGTRLVSYGGFLATCLILAMGIGFTAASLRTSSVTAPVLSREVGPVMVTGTIREAMRQPKGGWRIIIAPSSIDRLSKKQSPAFVRLTVRQKNLNFLPGESISILSVLMPPPGPVTPGAFDYPRQVWFQQIGAVGYTVGLPQSAPSQSSQSDNDSFAHRVGRLRLAMAERIRHQLDGEKGAVAAALMTGDRQSISEEVIETLRISGLAHLLAISGLHMALIGGLVFTLTRFGLAAWEYGALHYPIKKIAAIVGLIGALSYLIISGAGLSTQRAFLMIALMFLAVLLDRAALSMRTVATAAFLIMLFTPESVLSVSFQMSFAATIALISVYEAKRNRWRDKAFNNENKTRTFWLTHKAWAYLLGILLTSLIAGLATGPFAAFHFNRVAAYGLLGNILAMPIVGILIMPCAVLAFILMPLGLERFALTPMGWGIDWVLDVASWVSTLQGAEQFVPAWPLGSLLLITFGGLWLTIWRRGWRFTGFVPIAIGFLAILTHDLPDVFIDREGKNLAVRNREGQLILLSSRRARFSAEAWMRRDGGGETLKAYQKDRTFFSCDLSGCQTTDHALPKVIFINDPSIFEEECQRADLIIATVPIPKRFGPLCRQRTKVIDRFDLWKNGSHAAWFENSEIRITNSRAHRGERPWVLKPERKGRDSKKSQ